MLINFYSSGTLYIYKNEYRIASGMTQAELAEKIDISTKQVSRIEVGDFYPSLGTFLKIAETLNMDLSDFVTPNPQSEKQDPPKTHKSYL